MAFFITHWCAKLHALTNVSFQHSDYMLWHDFQPQHIGLRCVCLSLQCAARKSLYRIEEAYLMYVPSSIYIHTHTEPHVIHTEFTLFTWGSSLYKSCTHTHWNPHYTYWAYLYEYAVCTCSHLMSRAHSQMAPACLYATFQGTPSITVAPKIRRHAFQVSVYVCVYLCM
jgi:hypothetical protein